MRIFDTYKRYKIAYNNSLSVMFSVYRKKDVIRVKLKDGSLRNWRIDWVWDYASLDVHSHSFDELKNFMDSFLKYIEEKRDYLEITYKDHIIKLSGVYDNGDLFGVFFREDYKFLNPENSIVIDIGANIGDTPIYFALNNARKIIALEPYPYSYNYALKNIEMNSLNDKITLLNAGYGNETEIKINKNKITNGLTFLTPEENGLKIIKLYSLKTLLGEYNINEAILKMDCEGCEYNLLNEENGTLRKFKRVELEFHYGYRNLESKLREAGFIVSHSNVLKSGGKDPILKKMAKENRDYTFGLLYAERV
ncbi:MAG: FkbM family methyltransferase [Thermodesulfobium sp.]